MDNIFIKRIFLIVGLLVIVVLSVHAINQYSEQSIVDNESKLLFPDLKLSDIQSFKYTLPDKTLEFLKKDNVWFVNNLLASNRSVEVALAKLLSIEIDFIASKDPSNFIIFEVNNPQNSLSINTTNKIIEVFIGKNTFNGGSFARFNNSNTTYATNITINSLLDNDVSFFRDKTITMLDPQDIEYISINNTIYESKNNIWYKDSKVIQYSELKPLIAILSNLEGIGFADLDDVPYIKAVTPYLSILIKTSNTQYKFEYIQYKENIYAKSNNQTEFLISSTTIPDEILEVHNNIN